MERNRATSGKKQWARSVAKSFLGDVRVKQYPDTAFISPAQALMLSLLLIGPGAVLAGIPSNAGPLPPHGGLIWHP
jgi:hypothetical protein